MKKNDLSSAVGRISDTLIEDAEKIADDRRKRKAEKRAFGRRLGILSAAACVFLCAVLVLRSVLPIPAGIGEKDTRANSSRLVPSLPLALSAYAEVLGEAVYPENSGDENVYPIRQAARNANNDGTRAFFERCVTGILSDTSDGNRVVSPLDLYMALAMTAECTDGNSRAQILSLLGADGIDGLRRQEEAFFDASCYDTDNTFSRPAASVFLKKDLTAKDDTLSRLTDTCHASVYRADVENGDMENALKTWLSEQTGGLLDGQIGDLSLDPETIAVLSNTLWYHSCWQTAFAKENTADGVFHGRNGDQTVRFMKKIDSMSCMYQKYDDFTAVGNGLRDGGTMWLLIPDEGTSVEALLSREGLLSSLKAQNGYIVTLEMPKFDVGSDLDLAENLKQLGLTDVFDIGSADFSALTDDAVVISAVRHAARVSVDEEGVTGAAYTAEFLCGSTEEPPCVTVCVDRPFIFYVESAAQLPLFAGTVLNID